MALASFLINPFRFGFTNLPDPISEKSAIPRAELFYIVNRSKNPNNVAAGSDVIQIVCELPQAFAYVLSEVHCRLATSGADEAWDVDMQADIADNKFFNQSDVLVPFVGHSSADIQAGTQPRDYVFMDNIPKTVIICQPGQEGRAIFNVNRTGDTLAIGNLSFFCRVLQFDVDQAHRYEVNTPIPVR